ncbi:hypothetical protein HMPREF0541_02656 [Lacticaseibacillus rhamnosus ATCC 21052]|nr:hypothetical protein HMPREF0541_02656 [Lacticaseibacillus rhamnosus ATCC 21052]
MARARAITFKAAYTPLTLRLLTAPARAHTKIAVADFNQISRLLI